MNKTNSVLVIEDDTAIRLSLFHTLGGLGFAVGAAASGEEGLARLRMASYDVILLDINMPGIGGKETCRRISQGYPSVPIIMLTVRDDKADIVETLDAGAIDYVTKPFQIGELTSRIRAAIRRQESATGTPSGIWVVGDLSLDDRLRRVEQNGREVRLTPREYETLRHMMLNANHVVEHERLLKAVWGPHYGNEREYLRVVVNQLRKKIEEDPSKPSRLVTISHVGYCLRSPSSPTQVI